MVTLTNLSQLRNASRWWLVLASFSRVDMVRSKTYLFQQEKTKNDHNGNAIQGHSRSPISAPTKSSYAMPIKELTYWQTSLSFCHVWQVAGWTDRQTDESALHPVAFYKCKTTSLLQSPFIVIFNDVLPAEAVFSQDYLPYCGHGKTASQLSRPSDYQRLGSGRYRCGRSTSWLTEALAQTTVQTCASAGRCWITPQSPAYGNITQLSVINSLPKKWLNCFSVSDGYSERRHLANVNESVWTHMMLRDR